MSIQSNYRAIFFDLDGTLLPMELEEFMGSYMGAIKAFVAENGHDGDLFSQGLKAGIQAMATHDDGRSNADAYWDAFASVTNGTKEEWLPFLNDFYENHFGEIGKEVEPHVFARHTVETLADRGYPLVLATMPMFPLRAVQWRLSWAGVDPRRFDRMTHYENSTSVKPKLAYYKENLKAAGLEPKDVLMVGNNTKEDLACMDLGMDAYLITDYLLDPIGYDLSKVKHGTFEDFLAFVNELPRCADPAPSIDAGLVG